MKFFYFWDSDACLFNRQFFNAEASFLAVNCIVSEFLDGCKSYKGPHELQCLSSLWEDAGCSDKGYSYPRNLSDVEVDALNIFNLE